MKLKLSNHARLRLLQRFGILGKKKIRQMTFTHILSISNNKRLYKIEELNGYFWWNKNSKNIITFLTEEMVNTYLTKINFYNEKATPS
jgi:hypothetical protein